MATTNVIEVDFTAPAEDADVRRFEAALLRIDRGTFGLCIDCDRPIERARLELMPLAEQCVGCAQAQEPVYALA